MQDHSDNPYAIMIVDKKKEVDEWLWEKYPGMHPDNIRKAREARQRELLENPGLAKKDKKIKLPKGPRRNSSMDGWGHGYDAGKKMEINKGVKSNPSKGQIN